MIIFISRIVKNSLNYHYRKNINNYNYKDMDTNQLLNLIQSTTSISTTTSTATAKSEVFNFYNLIVIFLVCFIIVIIAVVLFLCICQFVTKRKTKFNCSKKESSFDDNFDKIHRQDKKKLYKDYNLKSVTSSLGNINHNLNENSINRIRRFAHCSNINENLYENNDELLLQDMILRTKLLLAQINIKPNGDVSNGTNNLLNMRVKTAQSENQQNFCIPRVTINELNGNKNENFNENNAKLLQDQILQSNLISNCDVSNGNHLI